ncbi:MAG: hypothetical protein KIS92_03680 [Planctomycetota bacterium]|nr:hypothetical protein [Planctomycetota bacterium]
MPPCFSLLLACSGKGAQAAISQHIGLSLAGAGIGLAIIGYLAIEHFLYKKKDWTLAAALVLIVLHPAWWISAMHGDCGYTKFYASSVFVLLFIALALRASFRKRPDEAP